jgi:hypothetical protein
MLLTIIPHEKQQPMAPYPHFISIPFAKSTLIDGNLVLSYFVDESLFI